MQRSRVVRGPREGVADPLDRDRLDALVPHRPARVQHRSGSMWVLNTAAIDAAGIDGLFVDGIERDERGLPSGRLFRLDDLLRTRVGPERLAGPDAPRLNLDHEPATVAARPAVVALDACRKARNDLIEFNANESITMERLLLHVPTDSSGGSREGDR